MWIFDILNRIVTFATSTIIRNTQRSSREWCLSKNVYVYSAVVQVLYLLEVFILTHYGPPSTETPATETTTVRCHKNSWIYLTSIYYWWLLRPTITIWFDLKWKNTIRTALNDTCILFSQMGQTPLGSIYIGTTLKQDMTHDPSATNPVFGENDCW